MNPMIAGETPRRISYEDFQLLADKSIEIIILQWGQDLWPFDGLSENHLISVPKAVKDYPCGMEEFNVFLIRPRFRLLSKAASGTASAASSVHRHILTSIS